MAAPTSGNTNNNNNNNNYDNKNVGPTTGQHAVGRINNNQNHTRAHGSSQMYIPSQLRDPKTGRVYDKEFLLGKGGFAVCHSYRDKSDNSLVAIKIISRRMILKSSQREKIKSEILIHKSLNNPYIVKFFSHFDDNENIYFILELCSRRSMMELQKRRKFLLEPEVRYFLHQLLLGCQYLHQNNIIHRDLKLGNIFLDSNINVKIGDFGLATKVSFAGERKKTLCGTPNYIAPEILTKKGHSFEVDVWSIGCIIYTLLVGKAPFETKTIKDTYKKIQQVDYSTPSSMSSASKNLLKLIFQSVPSNRPSVTDILQNSFFSAGYHPHSLPESCLTTAPQFDKVIRENHMLRKQPLLESNYNPQPSPNMMLNKDSPSGLIQSPMERLTNNIRELVNQVSATIQIASDGIFASSMDDVEDPAAAPIYWISKWVDYSDKYGFGYQLCDNSHGSLFNDATQLILFTNGLTYQAINSEGKESFYNSNNLPQDSNIIQKTKVVSFFKSYMNDKLLYAGSNMPSREQVEDIGRLPYMVHWFRTNQAIVMMLSNATVQINFIIDHTKIILCPLMGAVTFIDVDKSCRTFILSQIQAKRCISKELYQRLLFAKDVCLNLVNALVNGKTKQTGN